MVRIPMPTLWINYFLLFSVTEYKLDIASSISIILAFFNNALAIAIFYFIPPLNLIPLSPFSV